MKCAQMIGLTGLMLAGVLSPAYGQTSYDLGLEYERDQLELKQKRADLRQKEVETQRIEAQTALLRAQASAQECEQNQSTTGESGRLTYEWVDDEGQTNFSNVGRRAKPPKPDIWNTIAQQCPNVRDLNDVVWCVNKMKAKNL